MSKHKGKKIKSKVKNIFVIHGGNEQNTKQSSQSEPQFETRPLFPRERTRQLFGMGQTNQRINVASSMDYGHEDTTYL